MKTRLTVSQLEPGDILWQHYTVKARGKETEGHRTVVIGRAEMEGLAYRGHVHSVIRVAGLDPERRTEVEWLAVPDQPVTVIRSE